MPPLGTIGAAPDACAARMVGAGAGAGAALLSAPNRAEASGSDSAELRCPPLCEQRSSKFEKQDSATDCLDAGRHPHGPTHGHSGSRVPPANAVPGLYQPIANNTHLASTGRIRAKSVHSGTGQRARSCGGHKEATVQHSKPQRLRGMENVQEVLLYSNKKADGCTGSVPFVPFRERSETSHDSTIQGRLI